MILIVVLRQAAVAVATRVLTLHCLWNVNTRWLGLSIKVPTSPHRYHLRYLRSGTQVTIRWL